MPKKLLFILLTSILSSFSNQAFSQTVDTNYVDGAIYLKLNDTSSIALDLSAGAYPELALIFGLYQVSDVDHPFNYLSLSLDKTYRLLFTSVNDVDNFISDLNAILYVDYAEKVPLFRTTYVPNDIHPNQWHLNKINAQLGWDFSTGDANVKIAIVDNAVSTTHEDLVANMHINAGEIAGNGIDDDLNGYIDDVTGFDVAQNDNDPNPPGSSTSSDPWIHGTHCAGIASASTDNGVGISGLGFNCSIIPVKCTVDSGQGNTLGYAYEGISYAINANADIISMSFGSSNSIGSITGQQVISAASLQGIVLVGAAGNDDSSQPQYPGSFVEVINVGSTSISDAKSFFSNYGSTVDVMAPGSSIYSTVSGGNDLYGTLSGTSMACPMVAGLCGLILAQDLTRTDADVRSILEAGCDNIDLENPTYIGQLGAGRINAFNSLHTLSISEVETISASVFPNPFTEHFRLDLPKDGAYQVEILNQIGAVVFSGEYQSNFNYGARLAPGVYSVVISNQLERKLLRVLKF
ncbi:MAG: serine protease [Crocinitomicaceae bacterium]|jgi:serine protease